ncbi:hypothetical protein ABW20_dc0101438 [Dactylellina cionopaga]|nr:hypothetical protein ABW20_dc0101438 [Dactylellina cionopaga]
MSYPLHTSLSDAEIANFYRSHRSTGQQTRLVTLSDDALIKSGPHIYDEAENLKAASNILNPTVVKVPKVYRAFEYEGTQYMVMERIHARIVPDEETELLVEKVFSIVKYLWTLEHSVPGPLVGGMCKGSWWAGESPKFETLEELENWANGRLPDDGGVFKVGKREMVFCHLNLVAGNILVKAGNGPMEVYLVDWENAGWFPKGFEVARMEIAAARRNATRFERLLLGKVDSELSKREWREVKTVRMAWEGREDNQKDNRKDNRRDSRRLSTAAPRKGWRRRLPKWLVKRRKVA